MKTTALAFALLAATLCAAVDALATEEDPRIGRWTLDASATLDAAGAARPDDGAGTAAMDFVLAADGSWALAIVGPPDRVAWGTWEAVDAEHVRLTPNEGGAPFVVTVSVREDGAMTLQLTEDGDVYVMSAVHGALPDPGRTPCDEPAQAHTASRAGLVGTWDFDYVRSTEAATASLPEPQRRMAARIAATSAGQLTFRADGTLAWSSRSPDGATSGAGTWSVTESDGPRLRLALDEEGDASSAWFDFVNPRCVVTWRSDDDPRLFLWRR